jgi:hypothetical protein
MTLPPILRHALIASLAASAMAFGADRLVLKSGRELVGRVDGEREHRILFHDDEGGEMTIARVDVRTIVRADDEPGLFAPIVLEPPSETAPATFIRFDPPRDEPGHLLTGVARFFEERSRTTLFLVGAVHIGEPAYYERLQDVLDSCDVVLFEGVGGGRGVAPSDDEVASMDALTKLQLTLKDALGLQFQKDGLDYRRPF